MEKPPPTLRTIAEQAGVTRSAVSLALRNHPSIPPGTRDRIQAIARAVGYFPDPIVSVKLAQTRARKPAKQRVTLAYLISHPSRSALFRAYFEGAQERANQLGYQLDEVPTREPGMTGRRLTSMLRARNIRGILIGPVTVSRGHLSLDWSQFAAATLGYSVWKPDLPRAAPHLYQGVALTLRHLKRLGYRRIGLALPVYADERTDHLCLAALLIYQQKVARADRVAPLIATNWCETTFHRWFQKQRPDVLVNGQPSVERWLRTAGQRIPEDVGFVTTNWSTEESSYAGINQNARLVGAAAVDLVVGQLIHNERGILSHPKVVLIPCDWVDGWSVRRV